MYYFTLHGITRSPIDRQQTTPGRFSSHVVNRETSGSGKQAQRNIDSGVVSSAWDLLINKSMLRHIQRYPEEEARSVLQNNDLSLLLDELDAFILIIYACVVYEATKLKLHELWNRLWGPLFFAVTMSCNNFIERMKFLEI